MHASSVWSEMIWCDLCYYIDCNTTARAQFQYIQVAASSTEKKLWLLFLSCVHYSPERFLCRDDLYVFLKRASYFPFHSKSLRCSILTCVGGFFLLESCCYIIHFFFTSGSVCAEHAGLCQSHHLSACLSRIKHAPMVFFCMCLTCRIHYFWNRWKKLRVVVSCVASKMCV